ncbi:MAG: methylated-DNA--[protein]-cysteine S-methyltransferase [Lachnospiraceae bacterium]|nr:methylated-DNA--[protein]-cysteine S-methyltransferase [Lachnospiraceae bacterium]MDY5699742.1 methylated-DNA--[protein]-cysteine S-methyltransferase [Lachnospiraceae bacterium]
MIYIQQYKSPLGSITMAADEKALTGLWFDGQKYFGETLPGEVEKKELPVFTQAKEWLDIYFQGKEPGFTPPLNLSGTPFRREIWNILLSIPYGQNMTYGQIADVIARQKGLSRMSAQAVGNAVGHNPVSLIVPCHRVVGGKGQLTGYAGGVDRKEKLLALEKGRF